MKHNSLLVDEEKLKNLETLYIYLWTRDAQLPVNQDTEDYIAGHLKAIKHNDASPVFSDSARAAMAIRILNDAEL